MSLIVHVKHEQSMALTSIHLERAKYEYWGWGLYVLISLVSVITSFILIRTITDVTSSYDSESYLPIPRPVTQRRNRGPPPKYQPSSSDQLPSSPGTGNCRCQMSADRLNVMDLN